MELNLPLVAGTLSTIMFGASALPMLVKAFRTKELASYSRSNLLIANTGNVVHSVYVFHLPLGPIWLLHTFYLVTTALMLFWYMRYEWRPQRPERAGSHHPSAASLAPLPDLRRSSDRGPLAILVGLRTGEYPTTIPHSGNDHVHPGR